MLTSLLLCLLIQVPDQTPDFAAFQYEQKVVQPQPKVEPETPKAYYFGTDKFGKRWKSLSENELKRKIQEIDQLPWEMVDDEGIAWQNQDKEELKRFVKERNYNNQLGKQLFLQWNTPKQLQKYTQPLRLQPLLQQSVGFGSICSPGGI